MRRDLTYRLQLLSIIKVYSIISITQLKPIIIIIIKKTSNSYKKRVNFESSSIINEDKNDESKIKKFINKKKIYKKIHYLLQ